MAGLRRRRSSKSSAAAPGRSRRRSRVAPSQQRRPLIPIEAWLSGEGAGEKRLCLLSSSSRFSFFLFSGECFEERSGKVRATSPDDVFERKKKLVRGGQNSKTSGSASLFKKKKKAKEICAKERRVAKPSRAPCSLSRIWIRDCSHDAACPRPALGRAARSLHSGCVAERSNRRRSPSSVKKLTSALPRRRRGHARRRQQQRREEG